MKKQVLAAILTAALAVSALAGCGNGNSAQQTTAATTAAKQETQAATAASSGETSQEAAETGKEITSNGLPVDYFAGTTLNIYTKPSAELDTSANPNDKAIYQMVEEATGIHVNWTILTSQAWSEQVNLKLSSGDMPDAFLSNVGESTVSNNMDMFYDLSKDDILKTYAPDVLATIEAVYPNGLGAITWPDGSIRSLPTSRLETVYKEANWVPMINTTWLKRVGMDMPTTTDELYEVLCAFRDQDANGNGDPNDEIPFGFADKYSDCHIHHSANFFGIANARDGDSGHYKMVKNGVVTPTADTDAWRAWLEWLHKLLEEGLLDVEGFSQTGDEWTAKLSQDLYGMTFMFSPAHNGLNYDDWDVVMVQGLEGVEPVIDGNRYHDTTVKLGLTIAADSENVPALLHWWNYISSSRELKMIDFAGEQGILWDVYDGEIYLSDDWKKKPEFANESASSLTNTRGEGGKSVLISVEEYAVDPQNIHLVDGVPTELEFDHTDTTQGRIKIQEKVMDYLQYEYIPAKFEDPEAVSERTFLETDLMPMMSNFLSTSIMDGITDESWNAYLKDLETYGYYDWIEWYQKSLDGEL